MIRSMNPLAGGEKITAYKIGYAVAIRGYEDEFPVLAAALKNAEPAYNPRIEWTDGQGHTENYCQIFRTLATVKPEKGQDVIREHLVSVEKTLNQGNPLLDRRVRCWGVEHFLGRPYQPGDAIKLRVLRDLVLRVSAMPGGYERREVISEVSLQVNRP